MGRAEILDLLRLHAPTIARKYGIRTLALFGSMARDEAGPDSDVDLLVEFDGPVDLLRFMDCRFELEAALHREVDLVMASALKPSRRAHVEAELLRVA